MQKIGFCERYKLTTAVLNGKKTMTRRVIKDVSMIQHLNELEEDDKIHTQNADIEIIKEKIARYKLGEVVAVAQAYNDFYNDECDPRHFPEGEGWTNKMFVKPSLMPHQIQITGVRIERLKAVSDDDCLKEGVFDSNVGYNRFGFRDKHCDHNWYYPTPREAFAALIDRPGVGRKGLWASNPFVVVYEFKLVK